MTGETKGHEMNDLVTNKTKTQPCSDLIHLDSYTTDSKLIISKALQDKTYVGRVYEMSPLTGGGIEFGQMMRTVFRAVADDSIVQVTMLCSPDTITPSVFSQGKDKGGQVVSELIARQAKVFANAGQIGWQEDLPVLNTRTVLITFAQPVSSINAKVLAEAITDQTEFLNALKGCGFYDAAPIDAGQLIGYYRKFANIFNPLESVLLDELVELKYQVFGPDQQIDFRNPKLGIFAENTFCTAVTAKAFPENAYQGLMNLVVGAPLNEGEAKKGGGQRISTPYVFTTTIRVGNQRKEMDRISNAIKSRTNAQTLPFKLGNEDPSAALSDLQFLESICATDGDKVTYVSMTAFLFGNTPAQAREAANNLKTGLNKLDFDARECRGDTLVRWAQALPLNFAPGIANQLDCEGIMPSGSAACLLPIYSDHRGNANCRPGSKHTGATFITRRGSAHNFDPYVTNSNPNGLIAAASGRGKSFVLQYIINNDLAEGTNVFLLDNGSSGRKYCAAVGGEFNQFSMNSTDIPSLNPFSGLSEEEFDEQQEGITALLLMMAYENETPQPGARIAMSEAVRAAYAKEQSDADLMTVVSSLEAIFHNLESMQNITEVQSSARNLVPRLKAFIESPSRGRFFRGKGTINPKKQFTVFELGGLEGDQHLRRCVLFFVFNSLMTRIKTLPGRKKIYVDESFDLLADPGVADALEGIYFKGRKYTVSIWTVMQSLLKLVTIPAGSVIMKQSAWKLILGQTRGEVEELFKKELLPEFASDEYFKNLLRSITTVKGVFSEILFIGENYYECARLYVDRFTSALFSTEGDARDEVFAAMDRGVNVIDAINQLIGDKQARNESFIRETLKLLLQDGLTKAEILDSVEKIFV